VGLHINEDKTKYMHIQKTGSRNKRPLQISSYFFEKVNNFIYLGATLNENKQMRFEIAERIRKGNRDYYANAKI
jgi:hypothetical protein